MAPDQGLTIQIKSRHQKQTHFFSADPGLPPSQHTTFYTHFDPAAFFRHWHESFHPGNTVGLRLVHWFGVGWLQLALFGSLFVGGRRSVCQCVRRGMPFDRMGARGRLCLPGRGFSTLVASCGTPFSLEKRRRSMPRTSGSDEDRFQLRSVAWIARFWKESEEQQEARSTIFECASGCVVFWRTITSALSFAACMRG